MKIKAAVKNYNRNKFVKKKSIRFEIPWIMEIEKKKKERKRN